METSTTDRRDVWAALLLLTALLLLILSAPRDGAFWWSDAPRHALNGVFVKDLVLDGPWRDPAAYAYAYYAQYPALTILFYPPLFYVLSAPLYALFGNGHEVALLAVMLHYAAFGWGCYRLARCWLPVASATGLALTAVLVPEIALWGRQVMLEVPAYAFLVWSVLHLVRHLRSRATAPLVCAILLLLAAMYTKISVAFVAPVYLAALWRAQGAGLWRQRRTWLLLVGAALALVPLLVLTLKFGQANVQSVAGVADSVASRSSLAGWLWYARQWPAQLGPPLLGLLVLLLALGLWRRRDAPPVAVLARGEGLLLGGWLLIGYAYFSLIDLKEARHSVYLLLPMLLLVFVGLRARGWGNTGLAVSALLAALLAAGWTFTQRPVPFVAGYADVARWLAQNAPPDSTVLFSGYRDGSFTFNLRAADPGRRLHVMRADKLLLRVAVRRELGVEQKAIDDDALLALLNRQAVHYLVIQPGFWNDLEAMRRFEALLQSRPQFERVRVFATPANHRAHETELVIWRNKAAAARRDGGHVIELPIIRQQVPVQANR